MAVGVLIAPLVICVTPTATPAIGSVTAPIKPNPNPLKSPFGPSSLYPAIGAAINDTKPAPIPLPADFSPDDVPANMSFGFLVEKNELSSYLILPTLEKSFDNLFSDSSIFIF